MCEVRTQVRTSFEIELSANKKAPGNNQVLNDRISNDVQTKANLARRTHETQALSVTSDRRTSISVA